MFLDDLSKRGYNDLTDAFLKRSKKEEKEPKDQNEDYDDLVKAMVKSKEIIKTKMLEIFYST